MGIISEYNKHKSEIESRLKEFSKLNTKEHIKELFFCILTPQSKAEKCWQAVKELEKCQLKEKDIQNCLKTRTRFHNNKARYIIEANKKWDKINQMINKENNPHQVRELLIKNVKGLGMKEASHFLRNIGKSNNNLAILDRHILKRMQELNIIQDIKIKNNKDYLEKEKLLKDFSKKMNIPLDAIDLLFWKIESGRIFK